MKSGKNVEISLTSSFSQNDFANHHINQKCTGTWGILHSTNIPYPIDGLGTVLLPFAPFVACKECHAAYMVPGYLDLVENTIACSLIISDKILTPNQIRFLRLKFALTQQQVVDSIDAESVAYYSKCETGKPGFALSADKQVRLKLFYATELKINRAEDYHKINMTSSRREDESSSCSVIDLKKLIHEEEIKKITLKFKKEHGLTDIPTPKKA
ncbi:MAG: hypothetical protein HQK54_08390 [Oligoflexales bacterium]|nr:hypothetical protein [Oligoflexales bacterium]